MERGRHLVAGTALVVPYLVSGEIFFSIYQFCNGAEFVILIPEKKKKRSNFFVVIFPEG